jgi:membrane associated rhomboid family serine protease
MKSIYWLILLETVAYLIASVYSSSVPGYLGFSTLALENGQVWSLLTSLFVHASLIHLALNMFLLFIFGSVLEEEEGPVRTLAVFFGGGVGSLLFGIPLYPDNTIIVGSSVGVSAVAGATLLMRPDRMLPWYLFRAPVGLFASIYLVFNVFLMFYDRSGLIAYPSHVLAFFLGVAIWVLFKETRRSPTVRRPSQRSLRSGE